MRQYFICLEGIDRSGKTSLLKQLNKDTNFLHTIVDRAFVSTAVYAKKYGRDCDAHNYINQLIAMSKVMPVLVVHCFTGIDTIIERIRATNEEDYRANNEADLIKEINRDDFLFGSYMVELEELGVNVAHIDTSHSTIEEESKQVVDCINQLDNMEI